MVKLDAFYLLTLILSQKDVHNKNGWDGNYFVSNNLQKF